MTDLAAVYRAGRVRRWHTNPELSHTNDYLDGHQGRVARIILAWHPAPSRALIIAALTHDDGEHAIGDLASPVKAALRALEPVAWARIEATEEDALAGLWGAVPSVSIDDAAWLRFADRLDAYMWASAHNARMHSPEWLADWADLVKQAQALGVLDKLEGLDL